MRMRRFLLTASAMMLSAVLAVAGFYGWFDLKSQRAAAAHNLTPMARNSLKHAYSAGMITEVLLSAGVSQSHAQSVVLALGWLNERGEQAVKRPQDSTLEMMRDLANNHAGSIIAAWARGSSESASRDIYADLAANNGLFSSWESLGLEKDEMAKAAKDRDLSRAAAWFEARRETLAARVVDSLEGRSAPGAQKLSMQAAE